MAIYGVDIHPQFQAGISIEEIRAEGFDFMAAKVSEGRGVYDSQDWLRRGKACGLLCLGYHYLHPGDESGQAAVFAAQLARADVPGMLDAEALAGDGYAATLTVAGIRRFLAECAARGAKVPLVYLPRWYWQRMGSPGLSGLPALWASGYVGGTGHATDLYEVVTPSKWAGYGGGSVEVLQFTDRATVAGHQIDANHYRGTREQLAALLGTVNSGHRKDRPTMDQLPATKAPVDPNSDPKTWPQRNFDVAFDVAGGWMGDAAVAIGGQDWGGRTVDRTRTFLYLASWMMPDGTLTPVDAAYTAAGGGRVAAAHTLLGPWKAPSGAVGVTVNYAAPGGGYAAAGRSA